MKKANNPVLKRAITVLEKSARKKKAKIWRAAAEILTRTSSNRPEVNLGRLSRIQGKSSIFLVPGKVLGSGSLDKKLIVGAYSFSSSAKRKIVESGGEAIELEKFVARYPEGKGVILVS